MISQMNTNVSWHPEIVEPDPDFEVYKSIARQYVFWNNCGRTWAFPTKMWPMHTSRQVAGLPGMQLGFQIAVGFLRNIELLQDIRQGILLQGWEATLGQHH